ncbi:guanine permease [Pseudoroseomonas deserti]|uniref:Guanine permease n=1 Tax=Teichococcus deserti TaxID=1817963 RepID=A0A1V2H6W1_9PROT|nr:NCS2 family permease [Pseudoroseomonas deserti]ONG58157.1 guanine permease [Pseudoroseomonas deserti]
MLERYFGLAALGSSPRREGLAGLATFMTMAYIIVVNPAMMSDAGIDAGAAFVATCLSAAIGSAMMGLWARMPVAMAPGMGLNAFFAYTVVGGMGMPWQVALGAVFLSGLLFFLVSLTRFREWLIVAIPMSMKLGIGAGIGLFLGLLGLRGMGIVVDSTATLVTLGPLSNPTTLLSCLGFLLMAGLVARGISSGIVIGILVVAALGIPLGLTEIRGIVSMPPSLAPSFFQLDIWGALTLPGMPAVVFTFFLLTLLDDAGTLIATTHRAGLMRPDGTVPGLGRALQANSGGAVIGAVLGTSTAVPYIESAAGIQAGGRSGLTALAVAALFLAALFFAPLATSIPAFATAPALLLVAGMMAQSLRDLDWDDVTEYLPAMITALAMPFTFSISTGVGLGFVVYVVLKLATGRIAQINGAVWVLAALSVLEFALHG